MSTILKALKKVEGKRDAVAARTEIPRALKSPTTEEAHGWSKRIIAIAFSLMVTVGVVLGYRFWQSGKEIQVAQKRNNGIVTTETQIKKSTISNNDEIEDSRFATSTIKPFSAGRDVSPKEPETSEKLTLPNRFTEATVQSPPIVFDSSPGKSVVQQRKRLPEKKQPSQKQFDILHKRTPPEPQVISEAPVQPKPSNPTISSTENSPKVDVPLLEDRNLEVQALVYSEDSTKRMIVLNGEILRQGYEYKGYIIETIESHRILVKKNGKISALLFGK